MHRPLLARLPTALPRTQRRTLARMSIIGRLGTDAEVAPTASGRDMVRLLIATSVGPSSDRETSWFRVVSFPDGKRKEFLSSLKKGTMMHIEADSRMRAFEDAQGVKRMQLDLVERSVEILSRSNRSHDEAPEQSEREVE